MPRAGITCCSPRTVTIRRSAFPQENLVWALSANGGELLFLAIATCYCNDVYREAAKRGIRVEMVGVEVTGEFGGVGEPARNVTYQARVEARATEQEIRDLMIHTDQVAEIQNSLRRGTPVTLGNVTARSTSRA